MVGRVSTYGLSQASLGSAMSVQTKYASAITQQSSGLVTSTYGGLGTKASTLISLETSQSRLQTWSDNTQTALDRTETMYSAVGSLVDQLTSLRSTISAAMSATSDDADINSTGQGLLEDFADLMNTKMDGRYLFAGSNTDTAPVDLTALSAATVPSTSDTSYYTGDSEKSSVRISEEQTLTYGVTANSTGFEQALRSANIIANMTTDPMDSDALQEAYDLATKALDSLIATQAGLSVNASRLESALTRQDSALTLLDTMASNVKDVDVAQVSVKVSNYQTQLSASYSALASINKLSLVNYL